MGNYRQTMQPVSRVYVLPRCCVALYNVGAGDIVDGEPLGDPVWTAEQVEGIRISESFVEFEQFATNSPYPEIHHLNERHEISFDAVWNVAAKMKRNTYYILALTWQDANLSAATTRHWIKRYYFGVTTAGRNIESREGNEFLSTNILRAQHYYEQESDGAPANSSPGTDGGSLPAGKTWPYDWGGSQAGDLTLLSP